MREFIKSVLIIGSLIVGLAAAFSFADAHAYEIKIKQPKPAPVYQVCDSHGEQCKETNAADATIAKLKDKSIRVFKITKTEVDLAAGTKGIDFEKK